MAFIERTKTRHIINLKDLISRCSELRVGEEPNVRSVHCMAVSFDDVGNFSALLTELQTVDILVRIAAISLTADTTAVVCVFCWTEALAT